MRAHAIYRAGIRTGMNGNEYAAVQFARADEFVEMSRARAETQSVDPISRIFRFCRQ